MRFSRLAGSIAGICKRKPHMSAGLLKAVQLADKPILVVCFLPEVLGHFTNTIGVVVNSVPKCVEAFLVVVGLLCQQGSKEQEHKDQVG